MSSYAISLVLVQKVALLTSWSGDLSSQAGTASAVNATRVGAVKGTADASSVGTQKVSSAIGMASRISS